MQYEAALQSFGALYKVYGPVLDALLLMFFRVLSFMTTAPIFNRKNVPFNVKLCAAVFFTGTLFSVFNSTSPVLIGHDGHFGSYLLQLVMNIVIGAVLGFIADVILEAIYAAGNLMTSQIGLSSASMLDPSTGRQSLLLETLFGYIATLVFIYIGGLQWMILALQRSFKVFPLFEVQQPLTQVISLPYLIQISGNVLLIGVQLMAPVLVVTISIDIMLGVVNRTAQQIPVYQLSMAIKPVVGLLILYLTLTTFIQTLTNYLNDYSKIF